jgi:dipeptidyl aminopeptidase/acylaminoacyl peptidase
MKTGSITFCCFFLLVLNLFGQGGYQKPPKEILDVLNAPAIPAVSISPARDKIVLLEPLRYPPISELAQPMLRIAGLRINPNTNAQHRQAYWVKVTLKNVSDGKETPVALPAGAQIVSPAWSPDGKYIAAGNLTPAGVELWIIDTATAKANKVKDVMINTVFGGFSWEDADTLSANLVPKKRGPAPSYRDITPTEPNIQETAGRTGIIQTFQDLLRSPNDERLFEYYCSTQLALIEANGKVKEVGPVGIYDSMGLSPDGRYLLVSRIERPFSYQFPYTRFPKVVEVWDLDGRVVSTIAKIPLQDNLPAQGVPTGPRQVNWIPTEPSTLMWAEALDGGDPRRKAEYRDKLMLLAAPFNGSPTEVLKVEKRFVGRAFSERTGTMFFYDFDRDTQRRRTFVTDYRSPSSPVLLFDLNVNDRYNDPGQPVTITRNDGTTVIRQKGDDIFWSGAGASPQGDRPFFRKMNLKTKEVTEIWRSGNDEYESFAGMIDDEGTQFFTRKESVTEPSNLYIRQVCPQGKICTALAYRRITDFKDPSPQLRGITKRLVTYKRSDGVDLSFTLYLPPGYKEGTRLPTLVWAYPLEFTDTATAGQVTGSTNRFTQIGGTSHLFFVLQGYAVLDNATMPIVGDPLTVNDTFVKQIVDSAQAAVDKGVELGVVDPERVGVGGHSYGAFMTANLLAHSRIFRAGIARSGAYNRTLTPFGFQSERRTFWEAPELYAKVSPFFYANKIKDPILFIHGEADNNTGTFPMQSERMYAAVAGNGGTARLVMLPLESHGYVARESIEHTLYEMLNWFDKYVKNAKPRDNKQASAND